MTPLPPLPWRRPGVTLTPRPSQLALTVSSSAAATLDELKTAHVERIKKSHADQRAAAKERARKLKIFRTHRGPVAATFRQIWRTCQITNGGHRFTKSPFRGTFVEQCKHCEMPKDKDERNKRIDEYTRNLMVDEVAAGNLSEKDLNFKLSYEAEQRIITAQKLRVVKA